MTIHPRPVVARRVRMSHLARQYPSDTITRRPQVFLPANGGSIATAPGAPTAGIGSSGPGCFDGPSVDGPRALVVLVALVPAFAALAALLLHRRDVT